MIRLLSTALITIIIGSILAGILFRLAGTEHRYPDQSALGPVGDIKLTAEPARVGRPFLITAHINGHGPGDEVTLTLPANIRQADFENLVREIPPVPADRKYAEVSWSVRADRAGRYVLSADCPAIGTAYILVPAKDR
jgi:hypothetical protein